MIDGKCTNFCKKSKEEDFNKIQRLEYNRKGTVYSTEIGKSIFFQFEVRNVINKRLRKGKGGFHNFEINLERKGLEEMLN